MAAELVVAFTNPGNFRYSGAAASLLLDGGICSVVEHQQNPLGELSLLGMNDDREKRIEQLAFMMHTKNRAIQMITRLSDSVKNS